ncbi:hypothetical protein EVAR_38394_1 [Eumeta japonica]|uniref:Uncharacterized protein n=1 Tax=Eumeta variegata TaxID=151549 RepID=A0A4C1YJU7_EUMVA|nr:hypothetical protein EVAR_38394_1 [Eumeta japonica]
MCLKSRPAGRTLRSASGVSKELAEWTESLITSNQKVRLYVPVHGRFENDIITALASTALNSLQVAKLAQA